MSPTPDIARVRIVGPESAGKSTLCSQLASMLGVPWVPEFARTWLEGRGPQPSLTEADLIAIAEGQAAAEDAAEGPVVLCDTDPTLTMVWSEVLLGRVPDGVRAVAASRAYALTLLLHPRDTWTPGDLRYQPDRTTRDRFFRRCQQLYPDAVQLHGPDPLRRRIALEHCRPLLER